MRHRSLDAVVFDLDGTLLDSLPVVVDCNRTVAHVGDGPADIEVARSCGAPAVAAAWGHQYRTDRDADVIVRWPSELLDLFGFPAAVSGGLR